MPTEMSGSIYGFSGKLNEICDEGKIVPDTGAHNPVEFLSGIYAKIMSGK
jgi:hypothetical protein